MALNFKPLQYDQEFTYLQKKHLKTALESVDAGTVDPQAAPTALTDNTAGTVSNTLAALTGVDGTGSNAAPLAGVKNSISSLASKINALRTDLIAAGVLTA
jgi:hypothetical protein